MNKSEVWNELKKRGVVKVVVEFSGGGDEGGVDDTTLFAADGKVYGKLGPYFPNKKWDGTKNEWILLKQPTVDEALSEALSEPVYDKYSSFAGEFHVNGTVVWDVETLVVKMSGNESYEQWDEFEEDC